MAFTLLPSDGADLSLLLRASFKASSTTLQRLDQEALQQMTAKEGIDFATAVLYERTRREHATCSQQLDELYHRKEPDTRLDGLAFVYVPNLAYFADPKSQEVGTTICRVAEKYGCRSYVAPTSATHSLQSNAKIVCEVLAQCKEKSILLASVSKGSADVKMALRQPESDLAFARVTGWIDVCGLSDGSPLVNILAADSDRSLERRIERWFRARGVPYVREVLAATTELGYGPGHPLYGPLPNLPHVPRLNVVVFPTSRHFAFSGSRSFHQAIAAYGPNDAYGLLRDMVLRPGAVYPIWGTDHYFEAHLDVERLAAALLGYMAPRLTALEHRPSATALSTGARADSALPEPTVPVNAENMQRDLPRGNLQHDDDWERLRHARERHNGFPVGRYLQPPPMLFTRDGHNIFLGDVYRGRSAFLIAGGPSLNSLDLSRLNQRGVLTCAVNNAAAVYRSHLWVGVDDPGNFVDAIWQDPGILKFVPLCHMEKHFMVRNAGDELVPSEQVVGDMPSVFGFRRNEQFREEQWLYEDTFNWGNHSKSYDSDGNKGSRSVMYVALRLLFYLGVRRVYLLGCDFRMEHGTQNYAFAQDRSVSSVRGNNESYFVLNQRLARLRPYFEREGFEVVNCTPNSGMTVFPYLPFDEAIQEVLWGMPARINTVGMYDRQQRERDQQKQVEKTKAPEIVSRAAPSKINNDCVVQLPELTLVTAIDRARLSKLALTWPTWVECRPEINSMPVVVIHDESIDPSDARCDFLREHSNLRFVRWPLAGDHSRGDLETALVVVPAREIATAWYVKLDSDVVAEGCDRWFSPSWFAPDAQGHTVACIGTPWGYTKPFDEIDRLDRWADSIPGLCEHRSLRIPREPDADRVRHPRIVTWCFFASTAWARDIAAFVDGEIPCSTHGTFLWYCAARRGNRIVRADMGSFGWRHVPGSERRLRRSCAVVVGAAV